MVTVKVPATSANLGPGFDALGLALQLYNYISIKIDKGASGLLSLEIKGKGEEEGALPRNEDNLVFRAIARLYEEVGQGLPGLMISQQNNIPLSRGLGSSAAAIVGGLVAANSTLPVPVSRERLLTIAAEMEGHPDNVAAALLGGVVTSCWVDEEVKALPVAPPAGLKIVIAVPDFLLATTKARDVLPHRVDFKDAVFNIGRVSMLIAALATSKHEDLSWIMEDRLHQSYRSSLVPGMGDVFAAARGAGALAAVLSGAGPSVIAFWHPEDDCDRCDHKISAAMKDAFLRHGICSRTFLTGADLGGALCLD